MKIFFKNQLKMIWKKWFSFIGIFILIFLSVLLTNSSLNSRENVNNIIVSLKQSKIYNYSIKAYDGIISDKGFQKIENHFFLGINLTKDQKNLISDNQIITSSDSSANDEIQKWNYNFRAWLINQELKNQLGKNNYQFASKYLIVNTATINSNIYHIRLENGFNDDNWTFVNHAGIIENKYNLKTSDMIILTQGRMPKKENEIVVSDFQYDIKCSLNNIVTINEKDYTIVGKGYNATNYIWSNGYTVWLNNSNMNNLWLHQTTNKDNSRNSFFFVNITSQQYIQFMTNININFTRPLNSINYTDFFQNSTRFQLADIETLIFSIFGFLIFIISSIVIIIILKKELNSQKVSVGILMSLGAKNKNLAFIMAISYSTILLLPILFGFFASFGLQFYLTATINKIIFIPSSFVIISVIPSIINLVFLPLILVLTLTIVFLILISKSPLALINSNTIMKPLTFKKGNSTSLKFIRNLRLTLAFAKSNSLRVSSTMIIFFVNVFVALFLLNFVSIYKYSTTFSNVTYTNKGNRIFSDSNPNISKLLDIMLKNNSYDGSGFNKTWHWVSKDQFKLGVSNGTYHEITNFSIIIIDSYNHFISPDTLKMIAHNPLLLEKIKNISKSLYNLLLQAISFWTAYDTYPYLTFGFKIYSPEDSIQYLVLRGLWETSLPFVNSQVYITAYKKNDFPQWIKYKGENDKQSLIDFNVENNKYVNAIFPLQLAKRLHLKIGDTIISRLTNHDIDTLLWSQIRFRVSGINNYNYLDNNVIVKQVSVFKYLIKSYENHETSIGNSSTIKISNYDNFINRMLVSDFTPEICHNVSFVNKDNEYNIISNISLNGSLIGYGLTNYGEQEAGVNVTNSLVDALQMLTIIVLIIAVIIILLLVNLMFQENKKDIISLKIIGYSNNRIISLIMTPYIIGFIGVFIFSTILIYFMLQITLQVLFKISGIWLLFSYSPILLTIFFLSTMFLLVLLYMLGQRHIG